MCDLSDLPNKVTYCNWRIGMVFNDTENYKFSHSHNTPDEKQRFTIHRIILIIEDK